jgi:RimJ/RimL family protein N-acetyltransferase
MDANLPKFEFRPLSSDDFSLMHDWLNRKHVANQWDGPQSFEEVVQKYSKSISSKYVFPFIVLADGKPVGFIQSYRADLVGGGWWVNEEPGTWGVDQFIGEDQLIGQGYGSMFLREFTDQLLIRSDVKRVISDPDPKNLRAIRCYEKAGFKMLGEVQTPDGPALLMERSKW